MEVESLMRQHDLSAERAGSADGEGQECLSLFAVRPGVAAADAAPEVVRAAAVGSAVGRAVGRCAAGRAGPEAAWCLVGCGHRKARSVAGWVPAGTTPMA